MSAANSIYVNEYYKRNDWIELYNTTDEEIDIEGMYLTDDVDNPTKYKITRGSTAANTTIKPHGYIIVWCDKLQTNSMLHSSFKLSAEGGTVMLSSQDMTWSDKLIYAAHNGDETVGRYPDGTDNVYLMNIPTIEKTNIRTSYLKEVEQTSTGITARYISNNNGLKILYRYGKLIVIDEEDENLTIEIYNAVGVRMETESVTLFNGRSEKNIDYLPKGIYVARVINNEGNSAACKFVK